MDIDCVPFNGVEDEIVLDNKVAVVKVGKFLLFRNSSKMGTGREQAEILLNLAGKRVSRRRSIGCNVADDFREVIFCNSEKLNSVLRATHGYAFGGPS